MIYIPHKLYVDPLPYIVMYVINLLFQKSTHVNKGREAFFLPKANWVFI